MTKRGARVIWDVRSEDIRAGGFGEAQLSYSVGAEVVARSAVYRTVGIEAIVGEPGDDGSWVTALIDSLAPAVNAAADAKESAKKAEENADLAQQYSGKPPVIQNNTWWIWDAEKGG